MKTWRPKEDEMFYFLTEDYYPGNRGLLWVEGSKCKKIMWHKYLFPLGAFRTKKAALESGYVIIPNFNEIDVFAIRTTRKRPKGNTSEGGENWVQKPNEQQSNTPELGEGRYVNADTINEEWTTQKKLSDGRVVDKTMSTAIAFDAIDFPFKFIKPEIMERTAEAMEKLCFDDIGILPNRNIRKGDPMVVGRIWTKRGYDKKCVSFLITWFVDTSAI